MRQSAAILLLALGGCWYDRPNPWDTSDDVEDLEEKTHEDWELEMQSLYDHPRKDPAALSDPDLEAWRDTVLASADVNTLAHLRDRTLRKIDWLQKRHGELQKLDPINAESALTECRLRLRTEKLRLRMLEEHTASR